MVDTLDINDYKGLPVYVLVEELLKIGQTEKVITMATQTGDIAIYNVTSGNIVYHGYIDINKGILVKGKDNEDVVE